MSARRKHIPQRTCVGCREVHPKRTLIRLVRQPQGVQVDPTSKLPGRGAYIHDRRACWQAALKGPLGRALKAEIGERERAELIEFMNTLTDGEDD